MISKNLKKFKKKNSQFLRHLKLSLFLSFSNTYLRDCDKMQTVKFKPKSYKHFYVKLNYRKLNYRKIITKN